MSCDVLIAGAGPVGLTMAAELARYGVSVRIVDPAPKRTDKSKALVVWSRTLELVDRAGASAALIAAGHRQIAANIVANGKRIARFTLDGAPTPYPFGLMIPQSETERILEEHLGSLGVRVERTVELTRFEETGSGVGSVLHGADGREESVQSQWLIGCDGAHSVVRHQLGLEFHGDTLISNWILADVYLSGPNAPTEIEIHWHAEGVLVFFPMGEGRCRLIFDVGPAADGDAPRPDPTLPEIQAALEQRGPGGIQAERPVWLASFRINERKVKDYRVGRVFLAGDAAHIHSPAGGQGMNTGMQDACNLAWKLALARHGLANAERMLASYSPERSGVGEQILKATGMATRIGTLHGGFKQAVRNELAGFILGLHAVQRIAANTLMEISVGYPSSPLNGPAADLDAGPKPGERAPIRSGESPIGAGSMPRFALCATADELSQGVLKRFLGLLEPSVRPPFDENGIWLVRPDGYVAMTAQADDMAAVVDYLTLLAELSST